MARPYARNSFEKSLDELVNGPRVPPTAAELEAEEEELAFEAVLRYAEAREKERQYLARLRKRVGDLPRHPSDYGTASREVLEAFIHHQMDPPPDPRVKP